MNEAGVPERMGGPFPDGLGHGRSSEGNRPAGAVARPSERGRGRQEAAWVRVRVAPRGAWGGEGGGVSRRGRRGSRGQERVSSTLPEHRASPAHSRHAVNGHVCLAAAFPSACRFQMLSGPMGRYGR